MRKLTEEVEEESDEYRGWPVFEPVEEEEEEKE